MDNIIMYYNTLSNIFKINIIDLYNDIRLFCESKYVIIYRYNDYKITYYKKYKEIKICFKYNKIYNISYILGNSVIKYNKQKKIYIYNTENIKEIDYCINNKLYKNIIYYICNNRIKSINLPNKLIKHYDIGKISVITKYFKSKNLKYQGIQFLYKYYNNYIYIYKRKSIITHSYVIYYKLNVVIKNMKLLQLII